MHILYHVPGSTRKEQLTELPTAIIRLNGPRNHSVAPSFRRSFRQRTMRKYASRNSIVLSLARLAAVPARIDRQKHAPCNYPSCLFPRPSPPPYLASGESQNCIFPPNRVKRHRIQTNHVIASLSRLLAQAFEALLSLRHQLLRT